MGPNLNPPPPLPHFSCQHITSRTPLTDRTYGERVGLLGAKGLDENFVAAALGVDERSSPAPAAMA